MIYRSPYHQLRRVLRGTIKYHAVGQGRAILRYPFSSTPVANFDGPSESSQFGALAHQLESILPPMLAQGTTTVAPTTAGSDAGGGTGTTAVI